MNAEGGRVNRHGGRIHPSSFALLEETILRGRYPSGLEYLERLQGAAKAKARLRAILERRGGEERVAAACGGLEICAQRFRQLRQQGLQAALTSLEDQSPGRPAQAAESEEIASLRRAIDELNVQLHTAQVREEIALVM